MKTLKEKTVLITGSARGIGFCTAEFFAKEGCKVILCDINASELRAAVTKLKKISPHIFSHVLDVSDKEAAEDVAQKVLRRFKTLDVLINNAGIGYTGELTKTEFKTWKRLLDVNLWGVLNMTYAFLPSMTQAKKGHIVNLSSGQSFFRTPTWGAYAAVKQAVACFSEVLYFEMKNHNINVTTVYPFMVNTHFFDEVEVDSFGAKLSMLLVPYYSMEPEKVARIIFKAVKEGRKVERVSFLNDIAYYGRLIPYFHDFMSRVSNFVLTRKAGTS